ncbi:MAG: hypothetical protein Q9M94_05170 [Candidatus Gracilibacteria bacterium]|nr:hypothetical protein [Candidatus Gracilibacteria bacterium]
MKNKFFINSLNNLINKIEDKNIIDNFNLDTYIKTEIESEKKLLGLFDENKLKEDDPKRYFLGTVPYANYIFTTILNSEEDGKQLEVSIFSDINPFRKKYENKT